MGDTGGEYLGFTTAGAGHDHQWPINMLYGFHVAVRSIPLK